MFMEELLSQMEQMLGLITQYIQTFGGLDMTADTQVMERIYQYYHKRKEIVDAMRTLLEM